MADKIKPKPTDPDAMEVSYRPGEFQPFHAPPPIRRAIFTLEEGGVVLTFPPNLSSESLNQLRAYFDVWGKSMDSRAATSPRTAAIGVDTNGE